MTANTILVTPLTVLCTAGFQNTFDRNIAACETNLKNKTYKSNRNFRTKLCNLSKKDRLNQRYAKIFFNYYFHNFLNVPVINTV